MGKEGAAPVVGGEVEEASWRLGSHVPEVARGGGGERGSVKPVGGGGCCWLKEEDARLGRCWATRPMGRLLRWAGAARRGGRDGWAASRTGPKVEKE
jgi:hypothetical protein